LLLRTIICLLAGWAFPAHTAVLLDLNYPFLENLLAREVFTEDGKRYVKGSKDTKCSFAYLAKPSISMLDGRLSVKARFTGRSALDVFGRCLGLGDDFDLRFTAVPYFANGKLKFKDVRIDTLGKDSYYIRRVRRTLEQSLAKDIGYPVEDQARKLLEQQRPDALWKQKLHDFQVSAVEVTPAALRLQVDFRLSLD